MHELLDLIQRNHSFWLCGHENPDGDCIGAQVALYHLLATLGKQVVVHNPDPPGAAIDFVLSQTPISAHGGDRQAPRADVLVLLDCAWLQRLGALEAVVRADPPRAIAVIDHHVGSEAGDGQVSYVDPDAPSTGALVYRMYKQLGRALSPVAAEGVFLSLVADTGWFRYSNTTAEVFSIAAELVEYGVAPSRVFDLMFRRNPPESVSMLAQGLARQERLLDGRYAYSAMERGAVEHAKRVGFDTDAIMESLRSVRGTEVVALFKELGTSLVKISLRAVNDVDVQAIAAHFGGGGHRKAAGAQIRLPLAEAILSVRKKVESALAGASADLGP